MALVVEDGTGKPNAESYGSVAEADAFHSGRGNAAWAAITDPAVKEQCMRRAADYMTGAYRSRWKGFRVSVSQRLCWPRNGVEMDDAAYNDSYGGVFSYAGLIGSDVIPEEVKNAQFELALSASSGPLVPNQTRAKSSVKLGPLAVVYEPNSPQSKRYSSAFMWLTPFFKSAGAAFALIRR